MAFPDRSNNSGGTGGDVYLANDNSFTGNNKFNGQEINDASIKSWNSKLDTVGGDPTLTSPGYMSFKMRSKALSTNYIKGIVDNTDNWKVGKSNAGNDNVGLISYAHDTRLVLEKTQIKVDKPIHTPAPVTPGHAANKAYVDNLLLAIAGLDEEAATVSELVLAVRAALE